MSELDVSFVIPVYNNAATLPELIDRLSAEMQRLGRSFELIFVDDGSRDASLQILVRRTAVDGRVRVIALNGNFGSVAARCAGFELVRGRRTVTMDADLENLPEDVPALLGALDDGHDLACGIRIGRSDGWISRRLPSALLNAYARRRLGTHVRDIWCGMRAMDSHVIANLAAEGDRRRSLTPLFIARAKSVVEVPIRHAAARSGSAHSAWQLAGIAADFFLDSARRPFVAVAVGAGAAGGAAIALLLIAAVSKRPLLAAVAMVALVGAALGAVMALIGEYVQRIYGARQGRVFYRVREVPGTRADD